jgi:hypothetical protein
MKKSDYQLAPVPNSAGELASARGLTDMERNGLGMQWQHDFVRRALLANYKPSEMMENAGSQLVAGGMENSGAYRAKLPGMIAAAGYGIEADALGQAKEASDQASDKAFGQMLSLRQQQDSMALQRDIAQKNLDMTVDASKKSWWDYTMDIASLGIGIAGVPGAGKIFKGAGGGGGGGGGSGFSTTTWD